MDGIVATGFIAAGPWDFIGHPVWPFWLRLLRDVTILVFFATTVWALGVAAAEAWRRSRFSSSSDRRSPKASDP